MANKSEAQSAIANLRDFSAGSWTGRNIDDDLYEVRSYGALIATWVRGPGWIVTDRKYTVTTTKHTNYTKQAIQAERDSLIPRAEQDGPTFELATL